MDGASADINVQYRDEFLSGYALRIRGSDARWIDFLSFFPSGIDTCNDFGIATRENPARTSGSSSWNLEVSGSSCEGSTIVES